MEYLNPREYSLSQSPGPKEIEEKMLVCANNIAIVSEYAAKCEDDLARATSKHKVEYAKAFIDAAGSVEMRKAIAVSDELVMAAQDDLDTSYAKAKLIKAHLDGWEAHYYAARKIFGNMANEQRKGWGAFT